MPAVPKAVQGSLSDHTSNLPAAQRISRKDGFDRVIGGESVADRDYRIFFVRNDRVNARLGIVASKRTFPRAVDRNRAKRFIREAFRQHDIKTSGLDIVVMAKRRFGEAWGDGLGALFSRVKEKCAAF